jgi:hypothetical protein
LKKSIYLFNHLIRPQNDQSAEWFQYWKFVWKCRKKDRSKHLRSGYMSCGK